MHCRDKKLSAQPDLGFYASNRLGPHGVPPYARVSFVGGWVGWLAEASDTYL
jgi:hypothetical protein